MQISNQRERVSQLQSFTLLIELRVCGYTDGHTEGVTYRVGQTRPPTNLTVVQHHPTDVQRIVLQLQPAPTCDFRFPAGKH